MPISAAVSGVTLRMARNYSTKAHPAIAPRAGAMLQVNSEDPRVADLVHAGKIRVGLFLAAVRQGCRDRGPEGRLGGYSRPSPRGSAWSRC